jgi:hypothetical protein
VGSAAPARLHGIGIWYRDHLDHQLPILLGPRGPFYQCTETEHLEPHLAAVAPTPPGWRGDKTAITSALAAPTDQAAGLATGVDAGGEA